MMINHYNQWNKTYKQISIGLLILTSLLVLLTLFLQNPRHSQENTLTQLRNNQKIISDNITQKQKRLDIQQAHMVLNSKNPKIRLSAKQILANNLSKETVKNLFPILLTYSSVQEYNNRNTKAAKYVSKSVLANKEIFASQRDDGTDYLTSGLHVKYLSSQVSIGTVNEKTNTVPVTILATYKAWFSNKPREKLANVYSGIYNYQLKEFITLNRITNIESTVETR